MIALGLKKALGFLASPIGSIAWIGAGLTALVLAFVSHNNGQQAIGASEAVTRQEKSNAAAQKAAATAAAKSIDPRAGGVLNPFYRD